MNKKAILLVSFGTLQKATHKNCVDILMDKVKQTFPKYTVKNIFTSSYILKKLKEDGNKALSLSETLDDLRINGYEEIVIQPTLLTEGVEYNDKILKICSIHEGDFRSIAIGKPALIVNENFSMVMESFNHQIGNVKIDEEVVFMGHGSKGKHNPAYIALQEKLDRCCSNITIGVLEDDRPDFSDVLQRLQLKERKAVYLMPLLFVAGMHVREDMLGGGEFSWKTKLARAGFSVRVYAKGLGENELFQEVYLENIKNCLIGSNKIV